MGGARSLVIAGAAALPYADFVRAVAAAAGLRPPRIMGFRLDLLMARARFRYIPMLPRSGPPRSAG